MYVYNICGKVLTADCIISVDGVKVILSKVKILPLSNCIKQDPYYLNT